MCSSHELYLILTPHLLLRIRIPGWVEARPFLVPRYTPAWNRCILYRFLFQDKKLVFPVLIFPVVYNPLIHLTLW
jgi:hypothetical protein